jgi:hypothetical protein
MFLLTCSPNSNPLFPPIANEVSKNLWSFWECWKTYFQPHWTLNLSSYWYVCTLLISFDPHCWFWNEKRFPNISSMISLKIHWYYFKISSNQLNYLPYIR